MARAKWNEERFEKWENETHIPEDVMKMVEMVTDQLGVYVEETVVRYRNRFDEVYAYAKGFQISHCTSSYETGPTEDMTPVFMRWLGGLGFEVCDSYGDNGLDSATNWHDTYWTKEIAYVPSQVDSYEFYDQPNEDVDIDEDDRWDDYENEWDY